MKHPLEQRLIRSLFGGCLDEGESTDGAPALFDGTRSTPETHMIGSQMTEKIKGAYYAINDDLLKYMGRSKYNLSTSNLKGLLREDLEEEGFDVKLALIHQVDSYDPPWEDSRKSPIHRLIIIFKDRENENSPVYILENFDIRKEDDYILEGISISQVKVSAEMEENLIHQQASLMLAGLFNSDSLKELTQFFQFTKHLDMNRIFDYAADKIPPAFMIGMQQFVESTVNNNEQSLAFDSEIISMKWRASPQSLDELFIIARFDDGDSEEVIMKKNNLQSLVLKKRDGTSHYAVSAHIRNKIVAEINSTGRYEGEITNLNLKHDKPRQDKQKVSP